MKDVTERIAALPSDKQILLLQRLKQKVSSPVTDLPLGKGGVGTALAPILGAGKGASPLPTPTVFPDEWIVRYRQNEHARLRLFCFPYAGGGASIFRLWLDVLPSEVEICGIQLPGREYRLGEPAYTRMSSLLETLADAIYPYLDRPFAFFGHSMGTLVSFELARQLRRTYGRQPICLYLAAFRAPQLPNPNIKIHHLPSEVFKVVLRADGIPERILQNEELMQAMLPTLRADFELCDTYEYREEPPLDCPFSVFGGLEDVRVSAADLEAWAIHSSAKCSLSMLPGSHFFLHTAQDLLLTAISQDLEMQVDSLAHAGFVSPLALYRDLQRR